MQTEQKYTKWSYKSNLTNKEKQISKMIWITYFVFNCKLNKMIQLCRWHHISPI